MSQLEGIHILGIRSFGINEKKSQKFKFFAPLTLFLGQNGCGKTTIIEAIKYACSGDLPGGSSLGQGFVSDPYMHHQASVMGQIKLSMKDVRGNPVTIIRVMKCEKGANNKLKFASLDGSIKYTKANGEIETLTLRNADLNNMTIQLLGVPRSILNNVLFCHQEESLWPLSEGRELKKKFDEIFDSAKYNNCVDNLRKIYKSKNEEMKVLNVRLKFKKDLKEEVQKLKLRLQDREAKLEKIIKEVSERESELEPIDKRLNEICDVERDLQKVQNKLASKESDKKNLIEIQGSIRSNLKEEFKGTDQELQEEMNSFDNVRKKQNQDLQEFNKRRDELENAEKILSVNIQKKAAEASHTQEVIKQYKSKLSERNELISDLGRQLKSSLNDGEDPESSIEMLKSSLEKEKLERDATIENNKMVESGLQKNLDKCKEKCVQMVQEASFKKQEITNNEKKLREINNQLKDVNVSDEKLKQFQKKISDIDDKLEKLASSSNEKKLTQEIETKKKEIRSLEEELEMLEKEFKILQKNSVIEKDIENQKAEIVTKESKIEKIQTKWFDEFKYLFTTLPAENLKKEVDVLLRENTKILNECNKKITENQKKVTKLEMEVKYQKRDLETSENELEECRSKIRKLCGDTDYNEKTNELQRELNSLQKRKGQLSAAKVMYEAFVEDIESKKCCPVCSTNFNNKQQAVAEIVNTMKGKIHGIPDSLKETEGKLEKSTNMFKRLLELKPLNVKIEELQETNPNLKAKYQDVTNDFNKSKIELEQYKTEVKKPQETVEVCNKVISSAALIDQYNYDISKSREIISTLESELIPVESQNSTSETEARIGVVKIDVKSLREACEQNQKKIHLNNKQCQDLREDRNKIVEKQLNLQKLMQGKPQLLERIKEIEEKNEMLNSEIETLNESLSISETDRIEARDELETTKRMNEIELDRLRNEYQKHSNVFSDILKVHKYLQGFSKTELEDEFNTIKNAIIASKKKSDEIVKEKKSLTTKIEDLREQLSSQEHHFRILKDNQALRQKREQEQLVDQEIKDLKKNIGEYNYRSVLKEKNDLMTNRNKIDQQIQRSNGQKDETIQTIEDVRSDLKKPDNKNIELDYRNLLIECKVNETAIENIKTYAEALETSICVFHKKRMTEINKSIRQLWRQIYTGNDIDYIEIDNEISFKGTRRVYSYKVLQRKNDVLLEMRGRCSAGQKVLACLIIRIALAEAFSSNCGILTLDEPTTNLDRENIDRLSLCLAKIVNSRSLQKNFQLVIITHDEEFLRALKSVENLRYYYKVTRDPSGCTVVTSTVF